MTHILGISAFYHDSAACLVRDGDIVAAAQEERFSRKKHDHRFPQHAIDYCLREAGLDPSAIDYVAFYDKPWLKFERLLETYITFAPSGFRSYIKAMPLWLKEKLWMGETIKTRIGYEGSLIYPEHHQSHAASAFYPSPFERAAVITADGVGEWATASWGVGHDNRIDLKCELTFPHSLGLLYSAFTYYTGFRVNSGEYKVMGLAPYGEPRYVQLILDELMDLREDGSFRLDQKYFNYCQGLTMTSKAFHDLFGGPPREPETQITQREMDLARSVQDVVEEVMLRMARHVRKETGEKNLCLAGGVALNCVANGKILREGIFDDIWIQPAAGDAGGALGAALFAWHQVLDNPRKPRKNPDDQKGSYLGPKFSESEIAAWLDEDGIPYTVVGDDAPERAADLIAGGKVIGWFSGRMEFGPRALGARSILGDPRNPETQRVMNLKIKHRESFRPFAPSCLEQDSTDFFDIDRPSPYMLLVAPVREARRRILSDEETAMFGIDKLNVRRSDIPAVTHVDYSARIQTVDGKAHPNYHRLITAFKRLTGIGLVVNTSFNVRGEPIVCTPQDAYRCFKRTEMDALFLEGLLLLKKTQTATSASAWTGEDSEASIGTKSAGTLTQNKPRSKKQLRHFGLVMGVPLALLGGLSLWKGNLLAGSVLTALSALFIVLGLALPQVLRPLERLWMAFAERLGRVMTVVILGLTFVIAFVPTSLVMKLLRKKLLETRFDRSQSSYWDPVEADGPATRPDKPY